MRTHLRRLLLVVLALACPATALAQSWTPRVTDSFTGSNFADLNTHTPDTGSGAWSADSGTLYIFVNGVQADSASYYRNLTTLGNKQYAQVVAVNHSTNPGVLLCVSVSGGNFNGYALVSEGIFGVLLRKFTGSGTATTTLATYAAITDGQTIRLEFDGVNTLTSYVDGVSQGTVTDSTNIGGYSGATASGGNAGDDFEAGDFSVASSAHSLMLMGVGQ